MKRLFLLFIICLSNIFAMPLYISAAVDSSLSTSVDTPVVEASAAVDSSTIELTEVSIESEPVIESVKTEPVVVETIIKSESVAVEPVAETVEIQSTDSVKVEPVAVKVEPAVETVKTEPVAEPAKVEPTKTEPVAEPVKVEPVANVEPAEPARPVSNSIAIAGRVIPIIDVNSTLVDSGDHVNHYDKKFYYGHNSAAVFGGIVNMRAGDTFNITYGGVTTTYRVAETVIYEKNTSNGLLQLNGEGDYMWYVSKARIGKKYFDVSLMTCYGTSYGNGDASHRFVIFAYKV